jgi:hypothetical protein
LAGILLVIAPALLFLLVALLLDPLALTGAPARLLALVGLVSGIAVRHGFQLRRGNGGRSHSRATGTRSRNIRAQKNAHGSWAFVTPSMATGT